MRNRTAVAALSCISLLTACNSLDKPGVEGNSKVVIPMDTRGVSEALHTLPAISGGTLKLSPDDAFAVISDPDRDRVSVVNLATGNDTPAHIALQSGDEPGRVDIDANGRAYVALRGSGEVLTLEMSTAQVISRTHICSAPRGLAVESGAGMLHVACAEGRLVSLNLADDSVLRDVQLDGDLRDVLVGNDGQLRVSTFKSSELITVDVNGSQVARTAPENFELSVAPDDANNEQLDQGFGSLEQRPMQSHLAWRSVKANDGSVMMLHQASAVGEVDIKARTAENGAVSSPYGGGSGAGLGLGCQSVVVTSLSTFGPQGTRRTVALEGTVVDVDMAISPDGSEVAIVEAGLKDSQAPVPTVVSAPSGGDSFTSVGSSFGATTIGRVISDRYTSESRLLRVGVGPKADSGFINNPGSGSSSSFAGCTMPREAVDIPGQATAVAYTKTGGLVVQSREPALLTIIPVGAVPRVVELGGDSVRDTGHELFHKDSGGGIACASCHAEGAEDGHVWNFKGLGGRRTQALHVGLKGTAPFHWAGDETDLGALMEDVFVGRMGGVHQSEERVGSLTKFLFALKPPTAIRAESDPAAARGKALFESAAVGCTSCHAGAKLTDNRSYDVGTSQGARLQVPSLRGVGYRAPFIHTGCAHSLRERFDPSCGGSKHGNTADLSSSQVEDLVAFLQTL